MSKVLTYCKWAFLFIAIGLILLSVIMYAQSLWHIPELITGLIDAALISLSLISSIHYNKTDRTA